MLLATSSKQGNKHNSITSAFKGRKMLVNQFMKVWKLFCEYYQESRGDYEYYNSPEMYSQSGFHGPHFREESDIVFHLARFCYNEFGDKWVHLDSPIYKMYYEKLDKTKRFIDIEISNPKSFMIKNSKRQIAIEVKWIWHGIHKARSSWVKDKLASIENDLQRLQYLVEMNCYEKAFMCIIDEEPEHTAINEQNKITKWEKEYSPVKVLVHTYSNAQSK